MPFPRLLTLLSIVVATSAGPMILHEELAAAPADYVRVGVAPANEMISLRVALASNNLAELEEELRSIATPGSGNFRKWLSKEEVGTYIQPSSETVSAFDAFASANGLTPTVISPNGDWVSLMLPVSQANTLFAADFQHYTHPSLDCSITRSLSVSLPSELVGHVTVLHPTTAFVSAVGRNVRLAPISTIPHLGRRDQVQVPASCNTTEPSGNSSSLLVTSYGNEFAEETDLAQFLTTFRPDMSNSTTFTLFTTDNGTNPQGANLSAAEPSLDIQYTAGIATNVPLDFLPVGGTDFPTALFDTATFIANMTNPPTVMTTSFGDIETNFGASVATKLCNEYMVLGAMGISVLFASGDVSFVVAHSVDDSHILLEGGVRGVHDTPDQCTNNTFVPVFPSTCPYVTSVGATQADAVAAFLDAIPDDFEGIFNRTGRGYPDVSIQGVNFEIIVNGSHPRPISGASASSPTFAAIIALINDRLVAAQKPVMGFLNPFLYSNASSAFTDVTIGRNAGSVCPSNSSAFDAGVGWDPLTGLGTPKFFELLAAAALADKTIEY
ncbi:Family S53 protease-like protein [Mycena sanguinolenta]|uniref:Family S53 protease-like protein n=1 Tax=Mycena sanguinolenta TaxID=230812 RepID=A0A8H6YVX1_9AGAR|nr:Family S53 protease-like protein [Mycena sanguinolenta]